MSEVADGEIPPWLLDDDGSHGAQVSAGSRTPTASNRNLYSFPEPGASSSRSARQNQPKVATDSTLVESTAGVDPLTGGPISETAFHPATDTTPHYVTSTSHKSTGKKGTGKKGTKPKQPTMVVYKVRPGDSLSVIAARSNTTVSQIMRDSKLSSTTIRPGQTIKVRYTPKGYKAPTKGGKGGAKASGGKGKSHTVASGQTLSGIASKYGVSTSSLMKANGLSQSDARKIRPGQTLKIPSKR